MTRRPRTDPAPPAGTPLPPGWPSALSAVTLFVEDLAASRDFYTAAFGLPVTYEDDVSTVVTVGGVMINLLQVDEAHDLVAPTPVGPAGAGARMQLTVPVDDVDATCAALAARGVHLLNGPLDRPWGIRTAAFQDPSGHVWEIAQPLP